MSVKRKQSTAKRKRSARRMGRVVLMLGLLATIPYFIASGNDGKSVSKTVPIEIVPIEAAAGSVSASSGSVSNAPAEVPAQSVETPKLKEREEAPARDDLAVQAVLSAKRRAVIAGAIDGKISSFRYSNGDIFKRGDVLVAFDCSIDEARLKEAQARQRATQIQLEAYEKLEKLESVSEIELLLARENNEQNMAVVEQIDGRLKLCTIHAPFDGRVTNKMASQFEFAQAGRVLMDIASREALRAEFLIPSVWLRWLNVGTPLRIYVGETDRDYTAKIKSIHGEVDPVSQSVQVVAEMEKYHEELLPGMSGRAIFSPETAEMGFKDGFIGLVLSGEGGNGTN